MDKKLHRFIRPAIAITVLVALAVLCCFFMPATLTLSHSNCTIGAIAAAMLLLTVGAVGVKKIKWPLKKKES